MRDKITEVLQECELEELYEVRMYLGDRMKELETIMPICICVRVPVRNPARLGSFMYIIRKRSRSDGKVKRKCSSN